MDMIPYRMIALVLVVALLLTAVTPARAEALEVGTILLLVGVGVIVVIIVAYLVVASVKGRQMAAAPDDAGPVVLLAYVAPTVESPKAKGGAAGEPNCFRGVSVLEERPGFAGALRTRGGLGG